jgi:hypothetical protein
VGRFVGRGVLGRSLAPAGKDADPPECLWHFKGRGRRQAVISGRAGDAGIRKPAHYGFKRRPVANSQWLQPTKSTAKASVTPSDSAMGTSEVPRNP